MRLEQKCLLNRGDQNNVKSPWLPICGPIPGATFHHLFAAVSLLTAPPEGRGRPELKGEADSGGRSYTFIAWWLKQQQQQLFLIHVNPPI